MAFLRPSTRSASYAPSSPLDMPHNRISVTETYPIELHYIKATFLQNQYHQCVQACRQYLDQPQSSQLPAQQTYVNFYLGLAHENVARKMHDFQQAKVSTFGQAEGCYLRALELLSEVHGQDCQEESLPRQQRHEQSLSPRPISEPDDPFTDHLASEPASDLSTRLNRLMTSPEPNSSPFSSGGRYHANQFPDLASLEHEISSMLPDSEDDPNTSFDDDDDDDTLHSDSAFPPPLRPNSSNLSQTTSRFSLLPKPQLQKTTSHMALRTSNTLPREASSISLLSKTTPPKIKSQGLMKPVRLGSPPRRYHLPSLPSMTRSQGSSKLPVFRTASNPTTPVRAGSSRLATTVEENVEGEDDRKGAKVKSIGDGVASSPVSPLTPEETRAPFQQAPAAVSPLSSATPVSSTPQAPPSPSPPPPPAHWSSSSAGDSGSEDSFLDRDLSYPPGSHFLQVPEAPHAPHPNTTTPNPRNTAPAIAAHTSALHLQLHTHLSCLRQLRSQTLAAQHNRETRGAAGPSLRAAAAPTPTPRLAGARSYWSFTPAAEAESEKERRKREGRARGWAPRTGERFGAVAAERCRGLAERALGELYG